MRSTPTGSSPPSSSKAPTHTGTNCSGVAPFCSFPTDRGWRFTKRTASTPPLPASRSCARRRGGWKTRQAKRPSATRRTSPPATGMRSRRYWPTTSSTDDRRRVVNAGIRRGRDAEIANLRAAADVGITYMTFVVIATRGERLILTRASGGEGGSGEFLNEVLSVVEINSHNQIAAIRHVRPRRLRSRHRRARRAVPRRRSGRPRAHVVGRSRGGYASLNRHEVPATTTDCVTIDHRRVIAFAPGEMIAYIRAGWDLDQTIKHLHRGCASAERSRSGCAPMRRMGSRARASTPSGGESTC